MHLLTLIFNASICGNTKLLQESHLQSCKLTRKRRYCGSGNGISSGETASHWGRDMVPHQGHCLCVCVCVYPRQEGSGPRSPLASCCRRSRSELPASASQTLVLSLNRRFLSLNPGWHFCRIISAFGKGGLPSQGLLLTGFFFPACLFEQRAAAGEGSFANSGFPSGERSRSQGGLSAPSAANAAASQLCPADGLGERGHGC